MIRRCTEVKSLTFGLCIHTPMHTSSKLTFEVVKALDLYTTRIKRNAHCKLIQLTLRQENNVVHRRRLVAIRMANNL